MGWRKSLGKGVFIIVCSVGAVEVEARVEGWNEKCAPLTPLVCWITSTDCLDFGEYKEGSSQEYTTFEADADHLNRRLSSLAN